MLNKLKLTVVFLFILISSFAFSNTNFMKSGKIYSGDLLFWSKDFVISTLYFKEVFKMQSPQKQKIIKTDVEQRKLFLENMIDTHFLAQEAIKRGYLEKFEVQAVKNNRLATMVQNQIIAESQIEKTTEEEIGQYYKNNIERFKRAEKRRARHIVIKDFKKAQNLLEAILENERNQHQFRRLARENSEDQNTVRKAGDLSFFDQNGKSASGLANVDIAVAKAVFSMKEGQNIYPELIKTHYGYHIVMKTGLRESFSLTLDEAKEEIVHKLKKEKQALLMEQTVLRLYKEYNVVVYEENLKYVVIDLSEYAHQRYSRRRHGGTN